MSEEYSLGKEEWEEFMKRLDEPPKIKEGLRKLFKERSVLEQQVIYTVTSVRIKPTERWSSRCWGYFFDKEKAIRSVKGNWTDLVEAGFYTHAVIEEAKEGFLQPDFEPLWFRFTDPEKGEAVECERPEEAEGVCCFGIG